MMHSPMNVKQYKIYISYDVVPKEEILLLSYGRKLPKLWEFCVYFGLVSKYSVLSF